MALGVCMTSWLLTQTSIVLRLPQSPAFPEHLFIALKLLDLILCLVYSKPTLGFTGHRRRAEQFASAGSQNARTLCRVCPEAGLCTVSSHQYTGAGVHQLMHFGIWSWLTWGRKGSVWDFRGWSSMRELTSTYFQKHRDISYFPASEPSSLPRNYNSLFLWLSFP